MQRLFSTFAEGWPGAGLLLQRVLTSSILLYFGAMHPGNAGSRSSPVSVQSRPVEMLIFLSMPDWLLLCDC
jgi:hypothetical protein